MKSLVLVDQNGHAAARLGKPPMVCTGRRQTLLAMGRQPHIPCGATKRQQASRGQHSAEWQRQARRAGKLQRHGHTGGKSSSAARSLALIVARC